MCGDRVETAVTGKQSTIVLCDGMGSGVKANILATLSAKILCTMISGNVPISDCIETLINSLPVCKVRQVAYSTFSVLHVDDEGNGELIEFDNPPAIFLRNGKCFEPQREKQTVSGKTVYVTKVNALKGDVIVMTSDGVILAGVGKLMNFGWQRPEVIDYLERNIKGEYSGRAIACMLASACNDLYMGEAGDDTTVAAVRFRDKAEVSVMVGPPVNREADDFYVSRFMSGGGKKIVCGGTSSQIVARYLHREVKTSLDFPDRDVPPIGYIDGVDLVTEGVLTLRKLNALAEKYVSHSDITPKIFTAKDGASRLAQILFEEATDITFYIGQSVNKAHEGQPIDITMKLKLIERLASALRSCGKTVTLNYN